MDHSRPDPTNPDAGSEQQDRRRVVLAVAITVTRTGGIAGLKRTWRAQPESSDAPHWIALIDECPWDAADPTRPIAPTGADRYMWHVDARLGDDEREAALADPEVQGPWRELIDAVRSVNGRRVGTS
ncbi:MAG: protealysin inhibitor emfourin [Microbacterium pygmaeum]